MSLLAITLFVVMTFKSCPSCSEYRRINFVEILHKIDQDVGIDLFMGIGLSRVNGPHIFKINYTYLFLFDYFHWCFTSQSTA